MKRSPINRVSKKRKLENAHRKQMLKDEYGGPCEAGVVRECTGVSTDGHEVHTRGRGGSITDRRNIMMICRPCHTFITDNPAFSDHNGFTVPEWVVTRHGTEAALSEASRMRKAWIAGLPFSPFWTLD